MAVLYDGDLALTDLPSPARARHGGPQRGFARGWAVARLLPRAPLANMAAAEQQGPPQGLPRRPTPRRRPPDLATLRCTFHISRDGTRRSPRGGSAVRGPAAGSGRHSHTRAIGSSLNGPLLRGRTRRRPGLRTTGPAQTDPEQSAGRGAGHPAAGTAAHASPPRCGEAAGATTGRYKTPRTHETGTRGSGEPSTGLSYL